MLERVLHGLRHYRVKQTIQQLVWFRRPARTGANKENGLHKEDGGDPTLRIGINGDHAILYDWECQ